MRKQNTINMKENLMRTNLVTDTECNPTAAQDIATVQQEQYYWHVLQEFYAMMKIFGPKRISQDLKKIREQAEGVKEEPTRIITL